MRGLTLRGVNFQVLYRLTLSETSALNLVCTMHWLGPARTGTARPPLTAQQYSYGLYSHGLYMVMAYIVMAYIVMAYIVMAYIVMAHIVGEGMGNGGGGH